MLCWWLWWPRWVGWGREVGTMGERSKRVRTDVCLQLIWASLGGSDGTDSACSAGDLGLIPVSGRSSGEGNGYLLQYSCLENSMDIEPGGLQSMGLHKSQTWLTFSFTKLIHFIMHQKLTILWSNYIPIKFFFFFRERNTVASICFHIACGKFLLQWQSWVVVIDHMGHRPTIFTLANFSQLMA